MKHIHHIIPRHMGGTDDPDNLIEMTVQEHAEAHRILYEKFNKHEDYVAWKALSAQIGKDEIMTEKARLGGYNRKNKTAWNKGMSIPRSVESIEKQRDTMTGVKRGPYKKADPWFTFRGKEYSSIDEARKDARVSYYTVKKQMQVLQQFQKP